MFKNTRIQLATWGAALVLSGVSACGGGDADVAVPTASTVTVLATGAPTATTTSAPTATTTTIPIAAGPVEFVVSVEAGSVEGGERIPVEMGTKVRLIVSADVADEVHLHAYDIFVDVTPGTPAVLEFVADIPGIFEVELELSGLVLIELVVEP